MKILVTGGVGHAGSIVSRLEAGVRELIDVIHQGVFTDLDAPVYRN